MRLSKGFEEGWIFHKCRIMITAKYINAMEPPYYKFYNAIIHTVWQRECQVYKILNSQRYSIPGSQGQAWEFLVYSKKMIIQVRLQETLTLFDLRVDSEPRSVYVFVGTLINARTRTILEASSNTHRLHVWSTADRQGPWSWAIPQHSRWRHQMETFSASLAICAGNSPVTGEFLAQRPVTQSFDVFFDLCLNNRLSKQSRGWWFETQSRPLWRHCNADILQWPVSQ